jgi:hypothetical protein
MRRIIWVGLAILMAGLASGCGAVKSGPPVLTVQLTTQPASVFAGATVVFNATTNDPKGVTWTLTPATGAGTLSNIQSTATTSSATYQTPLNPPSPNSVTIMVSSTSDASIRQSDAFSIQPAISVAITGKIGAAIATTYANPVVLNASVSNDPAGAGVQWMLLSGNPPTPCEPTCGTLSGQSSSQVSYTPPAAVPGLPGNTAIITATSIADNTKSDSDSFTIQYPTGSLSSLSGVYNFGISGFDSAGHPMSMEGSLSAHGDGTITNVLLDVNDDQTVNSGGGSSLGGTYTLESNFTGVISLNGTITGVPHNPKFAFVLSSDGSFAHLMSLDSNGFQLTGYLIPADTTQFSLARIAHAFIFTLNSNLPVRSCTMGRMVVDSSGNVAGILDSAEAGFGPTQADFAFNGTVNPIDPATGRATMSLDIAGMTYEYVLYIANSSRLFLMETDSSSGQLQDGVALTQGNFTSRIGINGTGYFALEGYDTAASGKGPMAALGFITVASSGIIAWDSNDAGSIHSVIAGTPATVTYVAATGRGTVSVPSGAADGLFDSAVFYLSSSLNGFVLDTTPGATNRALEGPIHKAQAGNNVPVNSPLILDGHLLLNLGGPPAVLDPASASVPSAVGIINASNGTFTGSMNMRASSQPDFLNAPFNGSFQGIDPNTGRGTAMMPGVLFGQSGPVPGVFFIGSQNLFVVMSTMPGVPSGLVGFNPD